MSKVYTKADMVCTGEGFDDLLKLCRRFNACEEGMDWLNGYIGFCTLQGVLEAAQENGEQAALDFLYWFEQEWFCDCGFDADASWRDYDLCVDGETFGLVPDARERLRLDKLALKASAKDAGILVNDDFYSNKAWVLHFGAYGDTKVLVWADSLGDALESAADVLPPGIFCDEQIAEEFERLKVEAAEDPANLDPDNPTDLLDDVLDRLREESEVDCTYTESGYIASCEWGCTFEDPTLDDIKSLAK